MARGDLRSRRNSHKPPRIPLQGKLFQNCKARLNLRMVQIEHHVFGARPDGHENRWHPQSAHARGAELPSPPCTAGIQLPRSHRSRRPERRIPPRVREFEDLQHVIERPMGPADVRHNFQSGQRLTHGCVQDPVPHRVPPAGKSPPAFTRCILRIPGAGDSMGPQLNSP